MWPMSDAEPTGEFGPLWNAAPLIDDACYLVHIEIDGVSARDLDVVVQRGHLLLNVRGELARVLALPGEVDGDHATASFADGVLTVRLPRLA